MINGFKSQKKWPWVIVLLSFTAFFLANGVLAYRSSQTMAENTASISNSLNILNLIEQLKVNLFRAESSQRGYVITSDEDYLIPYTESVEQLQSLLNTLANSTTELTSQKGRFRSLNAHLHEKLAEMEQGINYIINKQSATARKLVDTDRGYDLSLKIIKLIEEMEAEEKVLLSSNRLIAEKNHKFIIFTLIVANAVGLALALAAFYGAFRYSSRINGLYLELEKSNAELEGKVILRTEALQQYSDELERSNRELEDFAFVASHDLQEPLRKIRAFGDRLTKKYSDQLGDQGRDYIQRMHSASERMSRLIQDLLSFSRVTTQQKEFESVDLNAVLQSICENLEVAITNRSAQIDIGPLPTVDGDTSQLSQVFSNLLSNSLKFTAEGKIPIIKITSKLIEPESSNDDLDEPVAEIFVSDNGIGFEEQYKDRIFNLFQRLHGKDEYTGTGIGLAICRKIVERHRGRIMVHSEVGRGTEFVIVLPISQRPSHQLPTEFAA